VVARAFVQEIKTRIEAVGAAESVQSVSVRSRVEGEIQKIHFEEGQEVHRGDLLFTIDPRPYAAAVHLAEANLARAQSMAADAERRARENESAYQRNAVALRDLEESRANAEATRATVRADQASLEQARLQLEYCTIRSAVTGRVGDQLVDEGNIVRPDDTLLVLLNQIEPIYVTFSVPERQLAEIRQHMAEGPLAVEAAIPGKEGPPERGTLTFVDNRVDNTTGTVRLKGTFENHGHPLWPGQFVNAALILVARKGATLVPTQAVQASQEGDFVYRLGPEGTAERCAVALGPTLPDGTVIRTGLQPGDTVVVEGQLRLMPGARVQVIRTLQTTTAP
jgi:multidrug efflux system membrane fusion protein